MNMLGSQENFIVVLQRKDQSSANHFSNYKNYIFSCITFCHEETKRKERIT